MRRFVLAFTLSLTLLSAAPAFAAEGSKPFFSEIGRHFLTGARFYGNTISNLSWKLMVRLGFDRFFSTTGEGGLCDQSTRCAEGLVCLNTCKEASCARFEKHCVIGPASVPVVGASSICGAENLCVDGTECLRVCPVGATCSASHRCVAIRRPGLACSDDLDCKASCGALSAPEIGPGAYAARCDQGSCACDPVEITPNAERMACGTSTVLLGCPTSTFQACARGENGQPYATCLTSPEYGGMCFEDAECSAAACPEGATPFCDESRACKCRATETNVIACSNNDECSASICAQNEIAACVSGACACAPAGVTSACTTTSDCSTECPSGFEAACEQSTCVCQRTQENVPVACQTVADCGAVTCLGDFQKTCLDNVCACTRTTAPR
ncbi:MAG: hypothetical protein QY323_01695 [Patescibacteria group bacterium]|nr:MAG: hypothetical protein QY323_01695 [Patescibacteria group bacterium]